MYIGFFNKSYAEGSEIHCLFAVQCMEIKVNGGESCVLKPIAPAPSHNKPTPEPSARQYHYAECSLHTLELLILLRPLPRGPPVNWALVSRLQMVVPLVGG